MRLLFFGSEAPAMRWEDHITADPKILVGKPIVRGTRLAVEFILELLAGGWSVDDVLEEYPPLKREDIQACLAYAGELVKSERLIMTPER